MIRLVTTARVVIATAAAVGAIVASPPSGASTYTTVTTAYGADSTNQALTVYEPATAGPHPAVLFIHGGCWARGTLDGAGAEVAVAQHIADRTGWVVATMTYRVTSTKWLTMPADVAAALHLLQTGGFGVDPARVAVWGESAGGHLSLLTALKGTGGPGLDRPKAAVSVSGPVDMRTELVSGGETALGCVKSFEGGLPSSQAMLDRYWTTSPIGWIDKTDPAVFLANSVGDTLVPVSQPAQLTANLAAVGHVAKVVVVPTIDHSTPIEWETPVGGNASVVDTAIAWLQGLL